MIAVAVEDAEMEAASEFFELCKVPWEFFVPGRAYEVILSTRAASRELTADLLLVYSGGPMSIDESLGSAASSTVGPITACSGAHELRIYGRSLTFNDAPKALLTSGLGRLPMMIAVRSDDATVVRIGYDLFLEVAHLLDHGQPAEDAAIPSLEAHIHLLREVIARGGVALVEIIPRPEGAEFICCLTHDVDHPLLKNHWMDHTMAGFLHRASIGSLLDVFRGRRTIGEFLRNVAAAAELPLLQLGIIGDRWSHFDSYLDLEPNRRSTFFFIPEAYQPGRLREGSAPHARGSRYSLEEVKSQIAKISSEGGEIALHGIDSWRSEDDARRERAILTRITGSREIGVRMHWLYFDRLSPSALDRAGFNYDSSFGYNNTVGFRAGTTQVFKPLAAKTLLELPLNVMDTALFYPTHLNYSPSEALKRVRCLADETFRYGGVLTLNWHDRSIFPERLWVRPYRALLDEIKARGAWFATAAMSVNWFRKRRAAQIKVKKVNSKEIRISCFLETKDSLPGLRVRLHCPRQRARAQALSDDQESRFIEFPFNTTTELKVPI